MADEIGHRLRQIRQARGKSLAVIAGLAGISTSYLSRLESGERALERRSLIVKLAAALEVAPSEITGAPLAAPGIDTDDHALDRVRTALLAVQIGEPSGRAQPIDQLTMRVTQIVAAQNDADSATVGEMLPSLIADLHTTLTSHRDQRDVLRLLTLAHIQGTQAWLAAIGAPVDLTWQAATLARQAAERLDEPIPLAISSYGSALGLLSAGAIDLASRLLRETTIPLTSTQEIQLAGSLALARSLISAAGHDRAGQESALDQATELSQRTGDTNLLGFGFGPANVGVWRMQVALETGEHAEAAKIAESINPAVLPVRARQAVYWREYGRALAHLPHQRTAAVAMLRRAERISPELVHRHPFTRSVLVELLSRAKHDAVGLELRGMAYRSGLPV
ncbi:MAG TPA: helix-turn-helix transcriptional regulator [Pseudonocardiaceae bacterium]